MYSFRKSKKGFTLIELMVVVAIIGVLALLGLRVYSGQQEKAKIALVKANVGTVQVQIQTELTDREVSDVDGDLAAIINSTHIFNPYDGTQQTGNGTENTKGEVYAVESGDVFYVSGYNVKGTSVYDIPLEARK